MSEVGGSGSGPEAEKAALKAPRARAARAGVRTAHRPEAPAEPDAGDSGDSLWDVAGVAAYLHVPVGAIYRMTARRAGVRIPHIRLGNKLRFRKEDIDRWLGLLTVSNMDTLEKARRKAAERTYGNDPQAQAR
jgi:excisionase family DNA binding protein